ncbi:hypothetical protein [Saccharothrix sp. HUAS TT1]|uniref:hypothetical protein n=1 Tax=unclassified Saccharothrix TaxID=2593673 RepID=UPI00345C3B9B
MGWQEELKALDDALASGKITPDQHRSQRDELLAAVSGGGPASPRWSATNPAGDQGQNQGQNQGQEAERTQVVPSPGPVDPNKTQVVRPVTGGFPQQQPPAPQQQRPWPPQQQPPHPHQQQGPQSGGFPAPPWADSAPSWQMQGMQGPEVFSDTGSGSKKWVGVVVGVLVVALIGGAVWWFGFKPSDDTATGTGGTSSAAPTAAESGFTADKLPDPEGKPGPKNGEYSLADAKSAKVVSEKDVKALETAGVERLVDKVAGRNGMSFAGSAFVAKDATAAVELADTLVQNQAAAGMTPVTGTSLPESVSVMTLATAQQSLYRAVYTSGDVTIRIATAAPASVPDKTVREAFQAYVAKVAESVKPS